MARVFTDGGAMKLASANTKLFGADVFSCAFWIYRTAAPAAERGLMGAGDFASDFGWWLNLTATGLIKAIAPYATVAKARNSSTASALNAWTHVVVNYQLTGLNSTDFTFYINGKSEAGTSVSNGAGAAPSNSATPFFVGPSPGTDTTANALAPPANIGPIAVWVGRILSPAEALALATGEHPLRFKEGLVEIFDMATAAGEEGWLTKVYLVQGATNPSSAAVSPPLLPPPGSQPGETHLNVRSTVRSRARYNAVAAASSTIFARPIMPSSSSLFGRQLAASLFAVHSVVGHSSLTNRAAIATRAVVANPRRADTGVRSLIGRQTIVPAPAKRVVADPIVATIKGPAPKALSWVGRMGASNARGPFRRLAVALVRSPLPRTESSVATQLVRVAAATPASSRARALLALIRSLRPVTKSTIGSPLPRVTVTTPAVSRARPLVASIRTPVPRVSSFKGPQGKWFLASHERWTKPIAALVRTVRPIARSKVGAPRPHIIPPAAPRPRPRTTLIRIPLPRIFSFAGSGKPSPAVLALAIAVSRGTIRISLERIAIDSLATQQNAGTASTGAEQSNPLALSPENYDTISLNP